MIAIFERRDALGMMFVNATPDEYEAMRRMEGRSGPVRVIGVAEHIVFNDESRVWSFAEWVEWAASESRT